MCAYASPRGRSVRKLESVYSRKSALRYVEPFGSSMPRAPGSFAKSSFFPVSA